LIDLVCMLTYLIDKSTHITKPCLEKNAAEAQISFCCVRVEEGKKSPDQEEAKPSRTESKSRQGSGLCLPSSMRRVEGRSLVSEVK